MVSRTFLASLAASAAAIPLTPNAGLLTRDVIDHDAVVGFDETVPDSIIGDMYLAYKPYLKVVSGCVPFPAVDAEGNTSGGLQPSGGSSAGCDSSTGQIYARSTMTDGTDSTYGPAIMYSWYMPKDEPSTGLGHRHDWEGVIVWLSSSSSTSADNILAVCPSAHGDWNCSTDGFTLTDSTHPLIQYYNVWPVNHQLGLTSTVGGTQPLIAWESLTDAAQNALQTTDFGDATVPFKDSTFSANLGEATY
ncbi:necrosis inducing protein-domain-containing protein [Aspergillus nidulans var. acristatus]